MVVRTKDVGLRLRLENDLRREFVDMCRAEGKPAAQVLRAFMRGYVIRNRAASQRDLPFGGSGVDADASERSAGAADDIESAGFKHGD
jgi:hypothetical protein